MATSWQEIASQFHVASARDILSLERMERYQDVRERFAWLTDKPSPVALLFISHRWQSTKHPDRDGVQLRALQTLLKSVLKCIEASLLARARRLSLVPSIMVEGQLQAQEIARRTLGYGPFTRKGSGAARGRIMNRYKDFDRNSEAFREWLAGRVGVWLDYTCMPQKPLSRSESVEFRQSLGSLDRLVASSTVVALRESLDDYSTRGWCSSEYLLGSRAGEQTSFAKALFVDVSRITNGEQVPLPAEPSVQAGAVLDVMQDSYQSDLAAFKEQISTWQAYDGAFTDTVLPDPWTHYRSLQGSTFYGVMDDPNPFRRAMEVIRSLESDLVRDWLLADREASWDVGTRIDSALSAYELSCTDPADLRYLGFLLASNGWVDAFKPLFRACLDRFLSSGPEHAVSAYEVALHPPDEDLRRLLRQASPNTAESWRSRLSEGTHLPQEATLVERVERTLTRQPLNFEFV